ncbi:hypothetical protein GTY62_38840 [Streptomyces sp. SID724]|uniref:hypothetical protein n=1 Tax=Streptomyces sp. SID724 TaxID=2690324 RepID=UPI0013614CB9|nr:hypothetical protein [Streptomyces sp. SID724]MYR16455.1 hypothetical protein [Streptomyces sp. SID724]
MSDKVEPTTQNDRLERLRALLSGARAQEQTRLTLGPGSYGNALMGAMLHGADRMRQGHEPTDLERLLLDAVGSVFSEEEIKAWGGVYREVAGAGGQSAVLPQMFAGRPVEEGYSVEDLKRDLPALVDEAMSMPNTQIVDPRTADREVNDPAFLAAMREKKFGITAFAAVEDRMIPDSAGPEGAGQAAQDGGEDQDGRSGPWHVRVLADNFYVHRTVGDQWGTADEIFWTAASGSGLDTHSFRSQQFDGPGKGDTRTFSTGNNTLFEGQISGDYLGLNIVCWEKDDEPSQWTEALHKALTDAMNTLNRTLALDDFVTGMLPLWISIGVQVANIFVTLMLELRNMNDISCQRTIGMGRYELAMLSQGGTTTWKFDGEGHHDLRVKWSGAKIPFAEGYLRCSVRSGSTWQTPARLPFRTITTPALAVHGDRLHALFLRPSDQVIMWTSMDSSGTWSPAQPLGGDQSWYAPALTSAGGVLHYAVVGKDDRLWTRTYTPATGWSPAKKGTGGWQFAPALATYRDQPWLVVYGLDQNLYHAKNGPWTDWQIDNLGWKVSTHVALAEHRDHIWRVAMTPFHFVQLLQTSYNGGGTWALRDLTVELRSSHAPALAANAGTMTLLIRSTDGSLLAADHNGSWQTARVVPSAAPAGAPAAAYYNNQLYAMYLTI